MKKNISGKLDLAKRNFDYIYQMNLQTEDVISPFNLFLIRITLFTLYLFCHLALKLLIFRKFAYKSVAFCTTL